MDATTNQSIQDIVERRKDLRIQRIDTILKEFDTLDSMIDANESYINLCYKYEQIYSLWVYIHRDFQPDELTSEEATVWRLMPAIILCYKYYLIKKREIMDEAGVNMDDRPVRTLRSLPKSSIKSDLAFIRRIISRISQFLHLKKRNSSSEVSITSIEKINLSIKSENKLKRLSENELKQEWKTLIKKFRKATAQCIQCHYSNSFTLVSNKKKTKWIKQVKKLVIEIEKPSIIDNDIKNLTDNTENLTETDLIERRERSRTQKESERIEREIEDEITIE
ncbi:hypothetical protein RclHR1_01210023 [Rhizophagus clarus]|uniref:Uncharacterized protein n=1 Tax=Rhizophagus clarus TaxID=94130 RepID=A0A2Z6Q7Q8_9GLOM|nr:hypothetical protein RclHR1_01210023 [Rhizophagus clarus]GES97656.1 hypothetical protein GLOIN_2v1877975 [Rhizophagus clarus]